MRAVVAEYDLKPCDDLLEALDLVRLGHRPFAGGTDLMVQFESGRLEHRKYVDVSRIPDLHGISSADSDSIRIGAAVPYSEILRHPELAKEFPMLLQAARMTGAVAIQNRGTLGGNMANASPAADSPPVLLVHNARIDVVSVRGHREIPIGEFYLGYKRTALAPDEMIRSILIPRHRDGFPIYHYRKVGTRSAQAISKICFAGLISRDPTDRITDVRIGLGAVGPVPLRCLKTEQVLSGKTPQELNLTAVQQILLSEISPITDLRSTREYRARVAMNLLQELIHAKPRG
jgi:CO/xanthine dehydrogenase FAD-binding subunit